MGWGEVVGRRMGVGAAAPLRPRVYSSAPDEAVCCQAVASPVGAVLTL